MLLKKNQRGIRDLESWRKIAAPMGKEVHWKDGRSAKELARYITAGLLNLPTELEAAFLPIIYANSEFDWDAEYKTALPGIGNDRNHDAAMWNDEIFVGIEGKVDEPLGNHTVRQEYTNGSDNKKKRIEELSRIIFGDHSLNHADIRYQLLTASAAILLEAQKGSRPKAAFIIVVFKKHELDGEKPYYNEAKIKANERDVELFLNETHAQWLEEKELWKIPALGEYSAIDFYFKKIEIEL